ncbi:MAG: ASKHA domain-containing protein [Chloroflexota bacterium]
MSVQIDFQPVGQRVEGQEGQSVLQIAREAGVGIASLCGGQGVCGSCRVQIVAGDVNPPTAMERESLSADELAAGYRLACLVQPRTHLRVHIPPRSLTTEQRLQIEGQALAVEVRPMIRAVPLQLPPPSLTDLRADVTRLTDALSRELGADGVCVDPALLRELSHQLRRENWRGVVGLRGNELVSFHPAGRGPLGLAVDVGTTKVAGYLLDLTSGQTLGADAIMNPQIPYGEDVMARITFALQEKDGVVTLQRAIVQGLNQLLQGLCARVGRGTADVAEAVVVGNTAMHHLFLGLPVGQLGLAPYVPAVVDPLDVKARDVGLTLAPGAGVHLLPNIAGFVGADHVAMLLATGFWQQDAVVVGLDIGTNTEVALKAGERLLTCSTASGPAFEGAHIRFGMRAASGAIERVRLADGQVEFQTIGHTPPVGLCGSGILDAVAQLRLAGVLDRRGKMQAHARTRQGEKGPEFVLVEAAQSGAGQDITISRADVGEIQLAKGAMRAGVRILLREAGLSEADLDGVVVAGAFGSYIDVGSAVAIGMFPPLPLHRFQQVGNAAGLGARLALLSTTQRALAIEIARRAEYVELTNDANFANEFARAMYLE